MSHIAKARNSTESLNSIHGPRILQSLRRHADFFACLCEATYTSLGESHSWMPPGPPEPRDKMERLMSQQKRAAASPGDLKNQRSRAIACRAPRQITPACARQGA